MYKLITYNGAPSVAFAHYHSAPLIFDQYFEPYPNRQEITYVLEGNVIHIHPDMSYSVKAPGIAFVTNDHCFRTYCEKPPHQHLTIGIDGDYTVQTLTAQEVVQFNLNGRPQAGVSRDMQTFLLLPDYLEINHHLTQLESLYRQLIEAHSQMTYSAELRATALLYEIFAIISEEAVREAMRSTNNFSPSNARYVQMAMDYISANLSKKIMVGDVAAYIQISPNYLSSLFKSYTGQSLVDYINRIKIEQAKELLLSNKGFLLREIAEMLGISDENYLSRLFKRYTNMSVRTFLQTHCQDEERVEKTDPSQG